MDTGENSPTEPCKSTFAREFSFDESPDTVPSRFWIPVAKLGFTDRSAKLAWLAFKTIFLTDIGMAGAAGGTRAAPALAAPRAPLRALPGRGGARPRAGPAG